MPSMDRLIQLLETAEYGSQRLDLEIANACDTRWADGEQIAMPYTTSLDAAMTLVSEVWWVKFIGEKRTAIVYATDTHQSTGFWEVGLQHTKGGRLTTASARTPALALSTAALKARQTTNKEPVS